MTPVQELHGQPLKLSLTIIPPLLLCPSRYFSPRALLAQNPLPPLHPLLNNGTFTLLLRY